MNVFPEGFLWGSVSAAVQVGGAYLEGGKGLNVADIQICYKKAAGSDNTNYTRELLKQHIADVQIGKQQQYYPKHKVVDFCHRYKGYIGWMKGCGFKAFRMSTSWVWISPNADGEYPSKAGPRFYDEMSDKLYRQGAELIVTLTHYDMPLKVVTHYQGWYGRRATDLYERLAQTRSKRYKDKVTYWIVINQINLISGGSFSSLRTVMDEYKDFTTEKYQTVHHGFMVNAGTVKTARELDPVLKVGVMLADQLAYTKTCDPQNVKIAIEKSRVKDSLFAGVRLRGEYLGYAKTQFKKHGITIQMEDGDGELVRSYTMDFLAVAYYCSHCVGGNGNRCANPYTKTMEWGWTIDPVGLYNTATQYWDHYDVLMMIIENGVGMEEVLGSDGCTHDEYRTDHQKRHIQELKDIMEEDTDIFTYTMWSPSDTVSGNSCGIEKRYGLIHVDIDDEGSGTDRCISRDSFYWYARLIKSSTENLQGAQRVPM